MKFTRLGVLLLATVAALAQEGAPVELMRIESVDSSGEFDLDPSTGEASALQGVVVRYRGSTVTARTLRLDEKHSTVDASGDVRIEIGKDGRTETWRGDKASFNFDTKTVTADTFRLGQRPFFAAGARAEGSKTTGIYSITDSFVTTDDLAEPGYRVRAKRIEMRPGEYIEARNAVVYVGNTPVLWLPIYHRSLRRHASFWTVTPGYRSVYGPFSLNRYHWQATTNVQVTLDADWRVRRGGAAGPGVSYDLGKWGTGSGQVYLAHDMDPFRTAGGLPVREDRRWATFRHSFTNDAGLTLKLRVDEQNDPLVIRDFFEGTFRRDPQPRTFGELNQAWANWTLDLTVQPQVTQFYQTVERLPDIKLTGLRQEVGETPLYYDSESSFAYLRFQPGLLGGTNYAGIRTDSYHQITAPQTYFGWLNFAPRVGGRLTYYGEPEGLPGMDREIVRGVFNTGAELNFKASRSWSGAAYKPLSIDGLRHIFEPGLNYVYVPNPNEHPRQIPQYDYEFITPRLLPIDFPDYNAIDSIDSRNVIRWSLRNRLQTKRAGRVEDVVNWALYTDWRLRPNPDQNTFPELYSDLDFAPSRWALLTSQLRYDINNRFWREANHRLTLTPGDRWTWTLGHRYLRTDFDTYGLGNNLFYSAVYYRFNENWGARAMQQFEARDGVLEEHSYSVYRDLRSWTLSLGFRVRDNRQTPDDFAIVLSLQLKAIPRFKPGQDADRVGERLFGS